MVNLKESFLFVLACGALIGSFKTMDFFGRQFTVGDFFVFLLFPFLVAKYYNFRSLGIQVLGRVEKLWLLASGSILLQGLLVGEILNGAFANGYRTFLLSLILYFAGRATDLRRYGFRLHLIFLLALESLLLLWIKSDIAGASAEDVLHIATYEGGDFGLNMTNLNTYGLLWVLVFSGAMVLYLRCNSKYIALVFGVLCLPGVIFSLSRSALFIYALLSFVFIYILIKREGRIGIWWLGFLFVFFGGWVGYIGFDIGSRASDRLVEKVDLFWVDLIYSRLGSLMIDPVLDFINREDFAILLVGGFSTPQHNSLTNAFIMYGVFGVLFYVFLVSAHLKTGWALLMQRGGGDVRMYGLVYLVFFALMFANDMATNILFYYPPISYLFYFILGLVRPYRI